MDTLTPLELLWLLQNVEHESVLAAMHFTASNELGQPRNIIETVSRQLVVAANKEIAQCKIRKLVASRNRIQDEVDRLSVIDPDDREIALRIGQLDIQIEMCTAQIVSWEERAKECEVEQGECKVFEGLEAVVVATEGENGVYNVTYQFKEKNPVNEPNSEDLENNRIKLMEMLEVAKKRNTQENPLPGPSSQPDE